MNDFDPAFMQRLFCRIQDRIEGPFDVIELVGLLKVGEIKESTLVCLEGTENWIAFQELPEFSAAQQIPIDVLARHLQKKEQARLSGNPLEKRSFPWVMWAAGMIVVCTIGAFIYSAVVSDYTRSDSIRLGLVEKSTLSASDLKEVSAWPTTSTDHFSILFPVILKSVPSTNPMGSTLAAMTPGAVIRVESAYISQASTEQLESFIQKFDVTRFENMGLPLLSLKSVQGSGYSGLEYTFSSPQNDPFEKSIRVRMVTGGGGNMIGIFIVVEPTKFSKEKVDLIMGSLSIH